MDDRAIARGGSANAGEMLDAFGRGPDARSTGIPSGGGVPSWMAEMLNYCSRCGTELTFGAIAITALEAGVPLGSPLIKLCVLIAAPLLVITTSDALFRIWRSAWAWMPVDRTKGLFRLAWVVTSLVGLAALIVAAAAALLA